MLRELQAIQITQNTNDCCVFCIHGSVSVSAIQRKGLLGQIEEAICKFQKENCMDVCKLQGEIPTFKQVVKILNAKAKIKLYISCQSSY